MFKLRFMVSEILENTHLFLTDPRNSSGDRQIIYLFWRPPDNSSGGRQINILYYISFVSPTGFRTYTRIILLLNLTMIYITGMIAKKSGQNVNTGLFCRMRQSNARECQK